MTTKVKNLITGYEWELDDEHALKLVEKFPYDFDIVKASKEFQKAIETPKMSTQEEKLLGIKNQGLSSMSFYELKAYCLNKNIDIKGLKSKVDILNAIKGE